MTPSPTYLQHTPHFFVSLICFIVLSLIQYLRTATISMQYVSIGSGTIKWPSIRIEKVAG